MVKLKFRVVNCSGEDPDFPSHELNVHSPSTKGWQSPRFCEFPQEIGLEFLTGPVRIQQIQILSHQNKISTRVELFVGNGDTYQHAKFKRLGYLSLDDNTRSGYRARELKSVYIDAQCSFLKLCMHKCYINKYNLYNQVGLIAINALGEVLGSSGENQYAVGGSTGSLELAPAPVPAGPGSQALDDLAFEMNFDTETATKIRQINAAKSVCVHREEYEEAKKLKTVEQQLKAIGIQLAKMESQKSTAVAREDYDAAQSLKHEIQRMRSGIDERLSSIPAYARYLNESRYGGPRAGANHAGAGVGAGGAGSGRMQTGRGAVQQERAPMQPLPQSRYADNNPAAVSADARTNVGAPQAPRQQERGLRPMQQQQQQQQHHQQQQQTQQQRQAPPRRDPASAPAPAASASGSVDAEQARRQQELEQQRQREMEQERQRRDRARQEAEERERRDQEAARQRKMQADARAREAQSPAQPQAQAQPQATMSSPVSRREEIKSDPFASQPSRNMARTPPMGGAPRMDPARAAPDDIEERMRGGSNAAAVAQAHGGTHPLQGVDGWQDLVDPEPIPPALVNEARELAQVFGDYVIQCFYSKTWALREAALSKIMLELPRMFREDIVSKPQIFSAAAKMLQMCSTEKVAQVFGRGLEMLKAVLKGVSGEVHRSEITAALERFTASLVEKLGNGNARMRADAAAALNNMAHQSSIGPAYVCILLLRRPKKERQTSWRPILGRLQLLETLINDFGFIREMPLDSIMTHMSACNAFAHGNSSVRDMARSITVMCYKAFGDDVEPYLKDLRSKQLEEYRAAFSKGQSGGRGAGGGGKSGAPSGAKRRTKAKAKARNVHKQQPAASPEKSSGRRQPGAAGASGGGSGGADGGAADGSQVRIENVDGQGRDININISLQASPRADGGRASPSGGDDEFEDNPFTCQFCGRYDPNFTEDMLDMHYWKECPMLTGCKFCGQVVEIMTMNEHLLEECEKRNKFDKNLIDKLNSTMDKCPLCQVQIEPVTESGWKKHVLRGTGCPRNPRTKHLR